MPAISFSDVSIDVTHAQLSARSGAATPPKRILDGICLDLSEHRIGIIGANGSGKSSLIRCINNLTSPTSGTISVDGRDSIRQAKSIRRDVGFLFSNADNQIVMPTVAEDVALSLRRHRLSRSATSQAVTQALIRVGLEGREDQSPHSLSGGEKQLLALASVLVLEPKLIIADEPTTFLDLGNRKKVASLLNDLDQQLITVTHDMDLVRAADRVVCIDSGRIVDDSTHHPAGVAGVIADYEGRM